MMSVSTKAQSQLSSGSAELSLVVLVICTPDKQLEVLHVLLSKRVMG